LTNIRTEIPAGSDDVSWREACRILEEEIARLPDDLRLPILLCLFEGRTQEEAAQELNANPRTVKDRLRRGRELLRERLLRRGVALAVLGALLSAATVEAALPAALEQATLQGAAALAKGAPLTGIVSPGALALTGGAGWGLPLVVAAGVLFSIAAAYLAWGTWAAPRPAADAKPRHVQRSFKDRQFDVNLFEWTGPMAQQFARREPEGLRITLPPQSGPGEQIGIKLRYLLRGDFDLETTIELLNLVPPIDPGHIAATSGAGAGVYLRFDTPERDAVWLGKVIVRGPRLVFNFGHRAGTVPNRFDRDLRTAPAGMPPGQVRLRLQRRGSVLIAFTAEGGEELRPFHKRDVSAADVSMLRIAGDPLGQKDVGVDFRLIAITLSAEEIVGYAPSWK
jgi:hypothetical protein